MIELEKPLFKSVQVKLNVPREVDEFYRMLGYDETDYQYDLLESMRSFLEAAVSETIRGRQIIKMLEEELKFQS